MDASAEREGAGAGEGASAGEGGESEGLLAVLAREVVASPVNSLLVALILVLLYKIVKPRDRSAVEEEAPAAPAPLRADLTPSQLRAHDGSGADGRICIAVNGLVFDVTAGRRFYGPGGPYSAFAGRDASRGLATFSVTPSEKEYDDLSDLDSKEMESVREWEEQFKDRYKLVGRLLKPGEEPTNYSEEETEPETAGNPSSASADSSANKKNE